MGRIKVSEERIELKITEVIVEQMVEKGLLRKKVDGEGMAWYQMIQGTGMLKKDELAEVRDRVVRELAEEYELTEEETEDLAEAVGR